MKQNLLARVYLGTIFLAMAVSVVLWDQISPDFAKGVFATAVWAVAGLWALENLLKSAVVPPGHPRNGFAVILWAAAKLAVYGVAVWVLISRPFPALSHAVGFTLMMMVLVVLGAASRASEIRLSERREDDEPNQQK